MMKMITLISCPLSLHGFHSRWEGGKDANERNVDAISETWGVSVICRCQYFKLLSFPVGGTCWAETDVQVSSVLRYCLGARFLGKSASMTQPFTVQLLGSFFLASQRAWRASETFSNLSLPLSLFRYKSSQESLEKQLTWNCSSCLWGVFRTLTSTPVVSCPCLECCGNKNNH